MPAQGTVSVGVFDQLVAAKKLDADVVARAKQAFVTTGVDTVTWLLSQSLVTDEDVAAAKAKYYNLPFIKLSEQPISPVAVGQIDKTVATRLQSLPFNLARDQKELWVAMANPADLSAIEFIERKTGLRVKPYVAVLRDLEAAIETSYSQGLSTEVTAALKESGQSSDVATKTVDIRKVGEFIKEAPIAKIVSTILEFAVKARASDVHIEPLEDRVRVRYRIDGILHEKLVLPKKILDSLVSRIKILSDLKIDEKRIPQDGRFNFKVDDQEVDLRVSTLPTVDGEKVVMRLLNKTGKVPSLGDLGLRGRALKNLQEAIVKPHGIVLVTGPTGSGKTTTLYSVLDQINTTKVNIVTIEDPVEYQIGGINQVQINPAAGLTFASGLRSFLRQDPNIIFVGEIRDEETSELAIQASLTGHLVLSTLHTNSAAGALPRLLDMHAEPYLLASTMTAIVGQRVGRKVCPHCKKPYAPTPEIVADMKKVLGKLWVDDPSKPLQLMKGEGCSQCGSTGYLGRVGIFEVLPVTEKIGREILEHSPASTIETTAIEDGMITMKQDGYLKVLEGITTIDEILRIAEE